ncbi:FAD-dependent oxidoreductase [Nonomuraea rhodomycinica]|uniref:FAD-dependent oxidoreductase n=1 Tax=Nonomuraea rhodomycinica TaxID=1712872 RepID=A0A7Y6ITU7_9ACTN|nr:FAD-dependent oxidoreductase [Nonomuraea rhodomycinica]NUW44125.1 FAD-dependent oxidoreductase [Nonomuraea rhodomycinica]
MTDTTSAARPSVVVLGGGYGGVSVAKTLDDVADVTLVDPTEGFVHNVAALRSLVQPDFVDRIYLPYERLLVHGRFVRDRAVRVDGRRVELESGGVLEPDYLVLATGSSYPFPAKNDEPDLDAAKARHRAAHEELAGAGRVLIVGAGPTGLELAGEIKAFAPDKHVVITDIADDVLAGPFVQELRDELRRQLTELGVELRLGVKLRELPSAPPATRGTVRVTTTEGDEIAADIWYRAFGVKLHTEYLDGGSLAGVRDERGYVRVDPRMRVEGETRVFALGDITNADRDVAAAAGRQAEVVAGNIRALITGEGEPLEYATIGSLIAVPLGPEGGSGFFGDGGIATPEMVAQLKGRDMMVDRHAALFGTAPDDAPAQAPAGAQ